MLSLSLSNCSPHRHMVPQHKEEPWQYPKSTILNGPYGTYSVTIRNLPPQMQHQDHVIGEFPLHLLAYSVLKQVRTGLDEKIGVNVTLNTVL